MTPQEAKTVIDALRKHYARDGKDYVLNEIQLAFYTKALLPYQPSEGQDAVQRAIAASKYFPAVSELLALLRGPELSPEAQAQLAWTTFERALARAGAYNGVTFEDGAIGETVRQVFGGWWQACQFDLDSPGWAIRRQSFLALYPHLASRVTGEVMFRGLSERYQPVRIASNRPQITPGRAIGPSDGPTSHSEAVAILADIQRRSGK